MRYFSFYFRNFSIEICFFSQNSNIRNFFVYFIDFVFKICPILFIFFLTKFVVSILPTLVANLLHSVFLTTLFLTTLLNLARSTGTGFNLSASILCTSVFKLAKFDFSAKLLTSTCDTFF